VSATVRPVGQPTWRCASRHFDRARFSIRQAPEFRPCPLSVHHPRRLVVVRMVGVVRPFLVASLLAGTRTGRPRWYSWLWRAGASRITRVESEERGSYRLLALEENVMDAISFVPLLVAEDGLYQAEGSSGS
jgi:hypothetical protein